MKIRFDPSIFYFVEGLHVMARASVSNALLALLLVILLGACSPGTEQQPAGARNVILFIGDGFGATQMSLGVEYARIVERRELNIDSLMQDGNTGYSLPLPFGNIVIESAAAATQMATGQLARNDMLGLDPDGYPLETILEWAHERDLGTGLVTTVRITHATPAAFAVHQSSRYNSEQELVDDILQEGDVDVLLGGGARALVPAGSWVSRTLPGIAGELDGESVREDAVNRVEELAARGYAIASDASSLREAAKHATKLLGMFSASHLPYVVDRKNMNASNVPTLAEMTSAALDVLSRRDEGFFLLVEAGRIDFGGHANDAGAMLHEILDLDVAVGKALEFQQRHPDTLVLVTGDHGTGGFSFTDTSFDLPADLTLDSGMVYQPEWGYPTSEHLELLGRQSASYSYILQQAGMDPEKLIELVLAHTGIGMTMDEANEALVRGDDGLPGTPDFRRYHDGPDDTASSLLGLALAEHTFVVWSTGEHTSDPVPTYGRGPGAEKLRGLYPNTHIYSVMRETLEQPITQ
jgi:alkaline phosphatase